MTKDEPTIIKSELDFALPPGTIMSQEAKKTIAKQVKGSIVFNHTPTIPLTLKEVAKKKVGVVQDYDPETNMITTKIDKDFTKFIQEGLEQGALGLEVSGYTSTRKGEDGTKVCEIFTPIGVLVKLDEAKKDASARKN